MTTFEPTVGSTPTRSTAPPRPASTAWRRSSRHALRLLFLAGDLAAVITAVVLSGVGPAWGAAATIVLIGANTAARLYRRRLSLSWGRDTPRGLAAAACALGLLVAAAEVVRTDPQTLIGMVRCVGIAVLLLGSFRLVVLLIARWGRVRGMRERVLVVGTGPVAVDLVRTMREHPQYGLEPVGFVDRTPTASPEELPLPLVGSDLADAVRETGASSIVLAFSKVLREAQVINAAITAHETGTEIYAVPRLFEMYHDGVDVERLRSYPLVRLTVLPTRRASWKLKRVTDFVVAAVGLVVAWPLMAAVALAVLLESGRPMLFRQSRVGKDGRPFDVLKFRSMRPVDETESQTQWSIAGDPRVGPVGRVLRRTSLDELPQLWNILRGDMSLVGPRPERPGFVQEFSLTHDRYWARHRVPAGLTGLAQVNGLRGDTSISERARYDNYYIANWSLWLDLQILVLTVREVFRRGQH